MIFHELSNEFECFWQKKAIKQQAELVLFVLIGQKIREILIVVLELVVGSGEKVMYL